MGSFDRKCFGAAKIALFMPTNMINWVT